MAGTGLIDCRWHIKCLWQSLKSGIFPPCGWPLHTSVLIDGSAAADGNPQIVSSKMAAIAADGTVIGSGCMRANKCNWSIWMFLDHLIDGN